MADLFTLVGTIALDYKSAEETIDRLLTKTKLLKERVDGSGGSTSSGGGTSVTPAATAGGSTTGTGKNGVNVPVVTGGTSVANLVKSKLIVDAIKWVGEAAVNTVKTGLEWTKDYETSVINIQTMTGKTYEEAKAYYDEMLKLDVETPLNAESISQAVSTLLVNGTQEDQILPLLRVFGDVARGDNDTFSSIVEATAKALAGGKMDGVVSRQLVSAEVPIYDLLAELYGMTGTQQENTAALYEMREKGEITGQDLIDAFTLYTQPGHGAYNAMANAMQTQKGVTEQTEALAAKAAGRLVQEAGLDDAYTKVVKKAGDVLQDFTTWLDTDTDKPLGERFLETLGDGAIGIGRKALSPIYNALTIQDPELMPTNRREAEMAALSTGNTWYLEEYMKTQEEEQQTNDSVLNNLLIANSPEEYAEKFGKYFEDSQKKTTDPTLEHIIEGLKNGTFTDPMGGMGIPASNIESAAAIIATAVGTEVKNAITETMPSAISSGMGEVSIGAGNVTLNDGVLVGRILPRINAGLGKFAMRDLRE